MGAAIRSRSRTNSVGAFLNLTDDKRTIGTDRGPISIAPAAGARRPRMVKILEALESVEPAMMDSLHEDQPGFMR
jgi:hypothetical protein